jgi:hypothetical protein
VLGEDVLDLQRVDLQPADVDQQFESAGDGEVAVCVEAAEVAGEEVAVGRRGRTSRRGSR